MNIKRFFNFNKTASSANCAKSRLNAALGKQDPSAQPSVSDIKNAVIQSLSPYEVSPSFQTSPDKKSLILTISLPVN
ncbi:hypothetical protein [Candidatus Synchoanobacter obligatus]|uniref:Cell division topological specificity factor n=1 Tax=Candidatus Synchoanobacter obligatus TaxID=2919597 RepID=A0ABT1L7X2_9GAMM|nr:hypothetical protein [Candidatus Synchoanobacter obligatus]MCP8352635.1 hypothetical protein [Candidatus Synchoanobacter obligatus]